MSVQDLIDDLDAGLAENGEAVRVLRLATPPATGVAKEADCNALIRGYQPSDLVPRSGINQQDQTAIMSPTVFNAVAWPAPGIPRQGDRIISNRGPLTIQACAGLYVGNTLVRIEASVRGA